MLQGLPHSSCLPALSSCAAISYSAQPIAEAVLRQHRAPWGAAEFSFLVKPVAWPSLPMDIVFALAVL